jgi:hypothetical protein
MNTTAPLPPPLSLPSEDDNLSSHDTMNSNTPGTTYVFFLNENIRNFLYSSFIEHQIQPNLMEV